MKTVKDTMFFNAKEKLFFETDGLDYTIYQQWQ